MKMIMYNNQVRYQNNIMNYLFKNNNHWIRKKIDNYINNLQINIHYYLINYKIVTRVKYY